jgi:hypothetical protein
VKFGGKRNIHVVLPQTSYVKTKIATFERQLTLQDTLGGFVALLAEGDERAVSILDELALLKYNGKLKDRVDRSSLSEVDRELLYDMLETAGDT